ncbi:ABC transporter substrate-binding protein [Roseibacterium sp. SDUM158016]|uniref:MlaC/ttg2D family ABC transporter substrate-binding protein n=1 Tax=Roseicyclus sediminis TaxID=2980997 RepID=UPI0021CFDBBE|nr:ABC transporter substrate-binding protein [Roseibacterium sp. SDUM158016]MCU4652490.1 ABC transporter substrate-binding protein [Roseibacterium sp. SDUM158016]
MTEANDTTSSDMARAGRRQFLGGLAAAVTLGAGLARPGKAMAQSPDEAAALVNRVVADVLSIINSGRSEAAMIREFEGIFREYGDVPTIAASVLGPPARTATSGQMSAFSSAFQSYMARKYGRRFREFIGGQITVTGARPTSRYVEVASRVSIPGRAPFAIDWRVWDRSGQSRFIDILIEGVSLVISERSEIGSMLDARGGSIDRLTADLRNFG